MRRMNRIGLAAALSLFAAQASAVVVPTALFDSVTVNQTVTIEDDSGRANNANWFIFDAIAGASIDIDINRLAAPPDLVAGLYLGDVTGLDFGLQRPSQFPSNVQFAGLSLLDTEDDTENDSHGGPFGDPRFTLLAPETGRYSVIVATLNSSGRGNPFEITATGVTTVQSSDVAAVPLPAAALFLLSALGLGVILRRRAA
ncbi:MAG: hypothetical protein AAGH74_12670 [Pseudomonadota bacterium]